jgi:hypothetical protein
MRQLRRRHLVEYLEGRNMTHLRRWPLGRLSLLALTAMTALALSPRSAAAQGALSNGDNHAATISAPGELDSWTFSAASGDAIVLSLGEVGADSPFYPWLRLYSPASVMVAESYGTLSAHLNVNAAVAGLYRVVVASADTGNTATGSYQLTLAKTPGPYLIADGDEGGPMINGANHPGYIHRADQDPWTFVAAAGDTVSLSIGEVGADSDFSPWIRLFGSDGALLNQANSALGGKIDVTVPSSGTYTIVVASAGPLYEATGHYLLTLASTPGPFVVPSWDEGGPMADGVLYQGAIHRADLDQWVFNATAGEALTVDAAEIGGDSGFFPWLRLYDPSGAYLGGSFGATTAHIGVSASATGLYTVVVASADGTYTASGDYSLSATGIDAPPAVALGDIALNFGTYGLWVRANHAGATPQWTQIHQTSLASIARGDIDGTGMVSLIATFRGYGVWIWRAATGWTQLHRMDASQIITADLDGNGQDDIILDFPGEGLWVRSNNTTWTQLHRLDITAIAAGNIDGDINRQTDLIVNFAGYGVWAYVNNANWVQVHPLDAFEINTGDFDGNGQDDVVLNFTGQGIWIRSNNSVWTQLHASNSAGMTIGDIDGDSAHRQDIVINFAGYGVYAWLNDATWKQIHPLDATALGTVDLEKNGKDDVILNFSGYGVWLYKNNTTFEQLHPVDVTQPIGGRFDIN